MTEHEIKIIDESIAACERIIDHYKRRIEILISKKTTNCCFEDKTKIKLKVK